jgi:hypothetical protein
MRQDYATNVIAEAIYSQVKNEGSIFLLFKDIIAHFKHKNAVNKEDMWVHSSNRNKHMKRTTTGWDYVLPGRTVVPAGKC